MDRFYGFLKYCVIILIVSLICYQLIVSSDTATILSVWTDGSLVFNNQYLLFCLLLMPLNWLLESKKWQILMSPHTNISIFDATKTILAGVALGIATPARLGEYGGRLITSNPKYKTQVISATLLGSIAQNLCNIISGLIFSYFFLKTVFSVTYHEGITFFIVISIQIIILMLIYYNMPKVAHWIENKVNNKFVLRYSSRLKSLDLYKAKLLHKVLALSLLRYIVYFVQYLLIMLFLNSTIPLTELFGNIAGIYLIQSGIPLPAFLSIFARGELAILVWSESGISESIALMATFSLWFINLIIPTILGLVIIFKTDIKQYFRS